MDSAQSYERIRLSFETVGLLYAIFYRTHYYIAHTFALLIKTSLSCTHLVQKMCSPDIWWVHDKRNYGIYVGTGIYSYIVERTDSRRRWYLVQEW